MVQVKREKEEERSFKWEGRVEEEYLGGIYLREANMKNQWRHNELHLESCQTLAEGWLACLPQCETNGLHNIPVQFWKMLTEDEHAFKQALLGNSQLFMWMFGMPCELLSITVCLFPSVLRNSFINHPPHIPCRLPIYLPSLQRPYTQHASQSHLQFFSCSL